MISLRWLRRAFAAIGLILMVVSVSRSADPMPILPSDRVTVQRGEIPIILTAPHGGTLELPNVPERKGIGLEKGAKGFFTGRDTGTEELVADLSAAIEKRFGKKPYLIAARFHRKFIDPNRPPEIAYESPNAKPFYDQFHDSVADACKQVQGKFQRGLLLDLHGQGSKRDTIFRGTQNGKTVKLLIDRYGKKAQVGPESFFGFLAKHGCTVYPTDDGKEQAGFTGGYIVQTYGSHTGYGIDAIQLECGADYRLKDVRKPAAEKIADSVVDYAIRYLDWKFPEKPTATPAPVVPK
ncbi:N-formylglutamate amidohydrolase [Tuwongella immobilis]|uniref:N-formylglutamate amidohydrolase n=1 Tax=Tuwongella immobilis TaxID=692036 RepID=A0A6C2YK43_9BACT|nr:N-formylglutamate amidohydrolase [Tuwongella immobilis]VIP01747.1 n-formylglutamate amidohydrolase : Uncharacterized protein OS=Colwellia psychrerythraea GN=GAB14E_0358 PE=4 SV=1: FGase [Tuwongella immobilis]VTR99329.1 n-formylglutamate amidohydrolase : Uncharacterized protein OS=Colwellia psychrerythraea GN=GAB14E_0358 PE=4 SV=1: FGase [Tuwongella immobilis]